MKTRKPYPTDLNDTQWQILQPLLPAAKSGGRPATDPKREILNGIFYVVRGGIAWRMIPHDLPPHGIVYHDFRQWRLDGTWSHLNDVLRGDLRVLLEVEVLFSGGDAGVANECHSPIVSKLIRYCNM